MALKFKGTDGYVDCGVVSVVIPADRFTLELWISPGATEAEQDSNSGPMCKAESGIGWSWQLRHRTLRSLEGYLGFQANTSEGPKWVSVNQYLYPDVKYYIMVVFDGTNLSMFVNNALTDQVAITGIVASNAPLLIGQDGWGGIYNGVVDEIRLSDIDRNEVERSVAWNTGVGNRFSVDEHTVALWHMDEGTGTLVHDETDVNDGLISGDVEWVTGLINGLPEPEPEPGLDIMSLMMIVVVVGMMGIMMRSALK